ncbi:MAG: FAD-binding oxidoreductase [Nitratireductor sp.]|nr:FAD-binding oxidoreductase [Nitratireductor sp.]
MMQKVQVVVIGGGIVGASVLFCLARKGWTDSVLLERRNLTSGSTWHAAGNVTFFGHYTAITDLYIKSIETYQTASEESGQEIGFHKTGSLRLANNREELAAYEALTPLYDRLDADYRVILPKEIETIHPLLVTDGLFGAAYTPGDGHVDPTSSTNALAKAAKLRGAEIRTQTPAKTIRRTSSGWMIETEDTTYLAKHVVIATSFWAREMLEPIGLNIPVYPIQHHEIISGPVAELQSLDFEVPAVRDPYAPSNTRQEGDGFLCGVYESDPKFWATDGIPPDFKEELLVPELERLEEHLLRVIERIPAFGEAGIKKVNNGPMAYSPDGLPLLGPVKDMPGLWLATGFNIGIGTGGGSARFLAEWMNKGRPPYDLSIVYPSRYGNNITKDDALARIHATYAKGYVTPQPPV